MIESFFHPLVVQKLTDRGLVQKNYQAICIYACILIALIIAVQALEALQDWLLLRVRNDVLHNLHVQAFQKVLRLQMNQFTKQNSTEIINQLNMDIERRECCWIKEFCICLRTHFVLSVALSGCFILIGKWLFAILACIPVKFLLLQILSRKKEHFFQDYIKSNQSFYAWMSDRITGIREYKFKIVTKKKSSVFPGIKKELLHEQKISFLDICNMTVETGIQGIMTGIYYLLGGFFVCNGSMSMGSVLAFISYSGNVTGPISMLMNIKMIIAQIRPSFQRLADFWCLETETEKGKSLQEEFHSLELHKVCFGYEGKSILRDVSMKLCRGQKVAIIGENGSGKSTLIQILLRFFNPERGEIFINEQEAEDIALTEYRSLFSVVSQFPYLFQETIRKNLDYEGRYEEEELKGAFYTVGMEELLTHFPDGLDTIVGVDSTNLSGGEKQKLAFLRAMLHPAPIFIFDECTSNLDRESEEWFFTKGLELLGDRLVILITHQLEYTKKCDKIYEIKNGRIIKREE